MGLRQVLPVQTKRTRFKAKAGMGNGEVREDHLGRVPGICQSGVTTQKMTKSIQSQINFANADPHRS
ncbi:hypothetical protein AYO49_03775 [Verrucomicrobiaceae bacterium SCGC AG-212-N21]|nr:hypothetical protein AYO49_03775 [Verrucomicrobiaceae bacterium SCGC AG-212-N21]